MSMKPVDDDQPKGSDSAPKAKKHARVKQVRRQPTPKVNRYSRNSGLRAAEEPAVFRLESDYSAHQTTNGSKLSWPDQIARCKNKYARNVVESAFAAETPVSWKGKRFLPKTVVAEKKATKTLIKKRWRTYTKDALRYAKYLSKQNKFEQWAKSRKVKIRQVIIDNIKVDRDKELVKKGLDVDEDETHRILREGGRTGFTCWTKPGWIPSVQEVVPSFTGPPSLSGPWTDSEAIKATLTTIGFSGVEIKALNFRTNEGNVDNYLELMKLLLGKILIGEVADKYEKLMRGKFERGEMGMDWQALVVSAVKP
ncbi:hypothetical protein P7C71_g4945, partial [Lecanoromycetidae sp. Uapishka_2]